jgi:hypothetical protein
MPTAATSKPRPEPTASPPSPAVQEAERLREWLVANNWKPISNEGAAKSSARRVPPGAIHGSFLTLIHSTAQCPQPFPLYQIWYHSTEHQNPSTTTRES